MNIRNPRGAIAGAYQDHPLLGIGVGMYILTGVSISLAGVFYKDFDDMPGFVVGALIILFVSSFLCVGIGGVLFILGQQTQAVGFRAKTKAFFLEFWKSVKIPLLLTCGLLICIFGTALVVVIARKFL